jgi:general secretion pathway protein J
MQPAALPHPNPSPEGEGLSGAAGFTLIELMISLLMFALIAVAGVALVDSVLGVQGKTEVRLDRLTALQRAMLVVSGDLGQVAIGDVTGGGAAISFSRSAPGVGGPPVVVRYALARGVLVRDAGSGGQVVLRDVANIRWRFWQDGWIDRWPVGDAGGWPRAVEVEVTLAGQPSGTIRRVVTLPVRARAVS